MQERHALITRFSPLAFAVTLACADFGAALAAEGVETDWERFSFPDSALGSDKAPGSFDRKGLAAGSGTADDPYVLTLKNAYDQTTPPTQSGKVNALLNFHSGKNNARRPGYWAVDGTLLTQSGGADQHFTVQSESGNEVRVEFDYKDLPEENQGIPVLSFFPSNGFGVGSIEQDALNTVTFESELNVSVTGQRPYLFNKGDSHYDYGLLLSTKHTQLTFAKNVSLVADVTFEPSAGSGKGIELVTTAGDLQRLRLRSRSGHLGRYRS